LFNQTTYENMCWRDLVTQFQCSSGVISAAIQLGSLKTKQVALWQTTCSQWLRLLSRETLPSSFPLSYTTL